MAMNPMQRRTRNAFLIGFLIALVIMAIVVIMLVQKMKGIQKQYDDLMALQKKVPVAMSDIESGTEVTFGTFEDQTVRTTLSEDDIISSDDFEFMDEETGEIIEKYNSDGSPKVKKMAVKTDIPAGTIITKDMIEEVDNPTTKDQRIQEYNMIILPSWLKTGDYIDVRLELPTGEDYIVVSKKLVEECNDTTIWLKMSEDEILTLGNAIIEAYTIIGSKLYATIYTEAGRQEAAVPTYPVSSEVAAIIESTPNILETALEGLRARYNRGQREDRINSVLSEYIEGRNDSVEAGLQEEITKMQESRQQYVESLE